MEWRIITETGRTQLRYVKVGDEITFEPIGIDDTDIRPDLVRLINENDHVTYQMLFDYFDFGKPVDRDKLIDTMLSMLKEFTKK